MMGNPFEWFRTNISEIANEKKKKGILLDMKSLVLNSEKSVLSDIAHNISLQPMFEYLNNSNAEEIELICTILHELLSQLKPIELLRSYGSDLQKSLTHASKEVKEMSLKLLERSISEDTVEYLNTKQSQLLVDSAGFLASPERSLAQHAISMFIKMGSTSLGLSVLYSNLLLSKLKEVMLVDDISRFRVYEVVVGVSKISSENLATAVSNGIMGGLVSEVYSTDPLIELSTLELLSNLATTNHGLDYLLECNAVKELVSKLLKTNEELSSMLLPGLIQFFGNLCAQQPEHFMKEYPQVIDLLFNSFENSDEALLGVIVTTVGKIGSSCSGRLVFIQCKEKMNIFLKKIPQLLTTKNDLAITVMNSLCELLKKINGDPACNEITEKWVDSMGPDAFSGIISLVKLPFAEYRLPAFELLKTISSHQWGTLKLNNSPGMTEFLLDRSSEFNKECKQIKYEVICNMTHCPDIEKMIKPDVLRSLKEYVREGPFYVPIKVEMATEGAN